LPPLKQGMIQAAVTKQRACGVKGEVLCLMRRPASCYALSVFCVTVEALLEIKVLN